MSGADELAPGVQVGDYRLVRRLGAGGFGGVWQAQSLHAPEETVALKLGWEPEEGRRAGGRSRRELRVLLELDHPHIVRPLAHGRFPACAGGRPYLVMEYVEGEALDTWASRVCPSLEMLGVLFGKLLSALAHAHARGVLHRDVKPGNIMVDAAGQPKLLDWGAGDATGALTLTERGLPPGTPGYRSPQAELFGGPGAYACTPADDLYALGATCYVALTEVHPFLPCESREQLSLAVAHTRPVAPHALNPRVPAALGEWVLRLLAHRVEERFASAPQALEALRQVLAMSGVDWSASVYMPRPPAPPREEPTLPPTTGDGPPAQDVEVRAHHVLSALWTQTTNERREATLARRDALLAEATAREEAGAALPGGEAPPGEPRAGMGALGRLRSRVAHGWAWALGGLVALAACAGLLWKTWGPPPSPVPEPEAVLAASTQPPLVAPSAARSAPPVPVASATLTSASAPGAAPAKEGPSVNPPAPPPASDTRRPRRTTRVTRCVVGLTLAATQAACPGIPLRPPDEKCPAGALETIQEHGYELERSIDVWLDAKRRGDIVEGSVREGNITSRFLSPGKLQRALLHGRVIFGGNGRMFVRYTAVTPPGSSRKLPFCAQLGTNLDAQGSGIPMDEGSTPQAIKTGSRLPAFIVDRFY